MPKILMSACLLGKNVRYDGGNCLVDHPRLSEWIARKDVLIICPEVAGDMPVPRPPAEITTGFSGEDVLQGRAKIIDIEKKDVTQHFIKGAEATLALAQEHGIKVAILKAKSPSCGHENIYDGSFSGTIVPGNGATSALLIQAGIKVFNEMQVDEALDCAESQP